MTQRGGLLTKAQSSVSRVKQRIHKTDGCGDDQSDEHEIIHVRLFVW
jgi:hypothetical protein